jgi:hypothetical protein
VKGRNITMTLQELLKAQNLTDEQVKGILDAMKQNKIYTASEENLDVRYGKLKTDHDAMVAKDAESQKLIAELQKATKGQEDVQKKITEYEATIQKQQEELAEAKTESALKIGLLSAGAKATDIDYLIYKMNHDSDWKPELGEDGQVKGLDDKVKGLKTQFPSQFESTSTKKIEEKKLEKPEQKDTITKEDFNKMGYQARNKLFNENPELYKELSSN